MAEYFARTPRQRAQSFLLRRAREARGPVLELYSGAGELTRSLADAGLEVVGVEPHRSPGRLARLTDAGRVELVTADPRALRLKRRFGLVLAVGSALHRARTADDLDALFASAAAHLGRDGVFLLEATPHGRVRAAEQASTDPRSGVARGVRTAPAARRTPPAPHLARRSGDRETITRLSRLALPAAEILRRLEESGLSVHEAYGDFDERPLDPDSPRLICVARIRA